MHKNILTTSTVSESQDTATASTSSAATEAQTQQLKIRGKQPGKQNKTITVIITETVNELAMEKMKQLKQRM